MLFEPLQSELYFAADDSYPTVPPLSISLEIDGSSPVITIIPKLSKLKLSFVVRSLNKIRSLELALLLELLLKDCF